jgi:hypothetical protein
MIDQQRSWSLLILLVICLITTHKISDSISPYTHSPENVSGVAREQPWLYPHDILFTSTLFAVVSSLNDTYLYDITILSAGSQSVCYPGPLNAFRTDTPIPRNRFQSTPAPIHRYTETGFSARAHRYTETGFSARVPTNVWLIESALTSLHYVCHLVESLVALIWFDMAWTFLLL